MVIPNGFRQRTEKEKEKFKPPVKRMAEGRQWYLYSNHLHLNQRTHVGNLSKQLYFSVGICFWHALYLKSPSMQVTLRRREHRDSATNVEQYLVVAVVVGAIVVEVEVAVVVGGVVVYSSRRMALK